MSKPFITPTAPPPGPAVTEPGTMELVRKGDAVYVVAHSLAHIAAAFALARKLGARP